MFSIGQKVVYGQSGVCVIEDITEKQLRKNEKSLYYVLKPFFQQNDTIYAPVNSEKIHIREVISKEEANALISEMPLIAEKTALQNLTPEDYRAELSYHKSEDLAKIAAIIYKKKKTAQSQKKKLGFSDEKYMHIAENLLFGELSVALEIPLEEVKGYIEEKIKN